MIKKIIKENLVYIIIIISLIVFFSIVMRSSLHDKIIIFDTKVIDFVNSNLHKSIINIFKILTNFGDFYIPFIILILILIIIKNKWVFYLQTMSYSLAGIITYLAKISAGRPRPQVALIDIPKSFSFPSGHTLTSIVFYTMLCFLLSYNMKPSKRKIVFTIALILTILIATSRIYLGVHYFSDVVGGIIIAIPCTLMCQNIINKNFKQKLK